ncbi:MAG TPA: ATP-binding protein [Solirubrobacterales bacterium]|nr:ATP-binding protein [Solirubrobacterales bacterium]
MNSTEFKNPYRPGAGHMPPYLAGREAEYKEFDRLLGQDQILENLVLTGLRGVGKTVLMETFKPRALEAGWLWASADLSESASISETALAQRLLADLALVSSSATMANPDRGKEVGFAASAGPDEIPLSHAALVDVFNETPGLTADKIKATLEFAWQHLKNQGQHRVIFAYDEAQNLSDHAAKEQFPLSVLLDVFQSIQKKGIPFMLVLAGLPTLFPKLVDARTYAERMFRVLTLSKLGHDDSREAILKPIEAAVCPITLTPESVDVIIYESAGYPYFIQFICREVYDVFIRQHADDEQKSVPIEAIQHKLDADFFAGRWAKITDRQRELLWVVAHLKHADEEFTIQELAAEAKKLLEKAFSSSNANQMLASLTERGMIYKNRLGKYSFAVPLLGRFITRTYQPPGAKLQPIPVIADRRI